MIRCFDSGYRMIADRTGLSRMDNRQAPLMIALGLTHQEFDRGVG